MSSVSKIMFLFLGFVAIFAVAGGYFLDQITSFERKVYIRIGDQYLVADVANTLAARERGLAERTIVNPNEGMLFVFDEPGVYGFWMKGMKFPIDIVWIDAANRIVGFEENLIPPGDVPDEELKVYYPPSPITKALELVAGRAKLLRAQPGDLVRIRPLLSGLENGQ